MTVLLGKRIACTGSPESDSSLVEFLIGEGAEVVQYPCVAINPVDDFSNLDRVLSEAARGFFDWVCFTSTNAVEQVATRLRVTGIDLPQAKIAAIGTSTTRAVLTRFPTSRRGEDFAAVDFIPSSYTAAVLAAELPVAPGDTVLVPQADIAAPTLADGLRERGAMVTTVPAYRTITGSGGVDLPALLLQRAVDAVLFASPSAVTGCLGRFAREGGDPDLLASVSIVCIGPVTASAARECGLSNLVIAPEHTRSGMARALIAEFAAHREETHA